MKNPRRTTFRLVTSAMLTLACSSPTPPPEVVRGGRRQARHLGPTKLRIRSEIVSPVGPVTFTVTSTGSAA
jgi:hypothetical protein